MAVVDLLLSSKFDDALNALNGGEKIPANDRMFVNNRTGIFDRIITQKAFALLSVLRQHKWIETDLYEYDDIDRSIFSNLARLLDDDPASIGFLKEFIAHFENINEEVAGKTLLGYFFEKGATLKSIEVLADAGCDLNYRNHASETYIHQVAGSRLRKFSMREEEVARLEASYIEFLAGKGIDLNEGNIVNKTALKIAVEASKKEIIDTLLRLGADPNQEDKEGETAFFFAAGRLLDMEIYRKLRETAAPQFDKKNRNGVSLFFEFVRMMNESEQELEFLKLLISDGADLYQPNTYYGAEKTPLHLIAEKSADILQAVLDTGKLEINRQDNQGNTFLQLVCAYDVNYDQKKAKDTYRKVKLLLENGADASVKNDSDQTALMLASKDDLKVKTVELLLSKK